MNPADRSPRGFAGLPEAALSPARKHHGLASIIEEELPQGPSERKERT
jgi:hypothetical protein